MKSIQTTSVITNNLKLIFTLCF